MQELLDYRPPSGGHGHGTGLPGVAEFPAVPESEVMRRVDAALDDPTIGYSCRSSVLHLHDDGGQHTCVLLRRFGEDPWKMVTAFPLPDDAGVVINPAPDRPYPLVRVVENVLDYLSVQPGFEPEGTLDAIYWVAGTLYEVGEPYEATIWLLEMCAEYDVALPEQVYATLLAMANYEYFDATYTGAPFSALVADEWRRHNPETWE